jgi:hypothetical protein
MHPGVSLDTHIEDMLAVLEYEDLHDVVLVGHSYGGMVATGAPCSGQSLLDLIQLPRASATWGRRGCRAKAGSCRPTRCRRTPMRPTWPGHCRADACSR